MKQFDSTLELFAEIEQALRQQACVDNGHLISWDSSTTNGATPPAGSYQCQRCQEFVEVICPLKP